MKDYPTISSERQAGNFYAFDKLDGSNVRAEWDVKKGFWKFGKRNGLLDDSNPLLKRKVPALIQEFGESFADAAGVKRRRWKKAIAYFEFVGSNSFAGSHDENDEHRVVLIDIAVDKRGFLHPVDFLDFAGDSQIPSADLLHTGPCGPLFVQSVRDSRLYGMTFEGVVCKGGFVTPGLPAMFKIKSEAWYRKLRVRCDGDEELFKRLA